jgi:uncharacterized protein
MTPTLLTLLACPTCGGPLQVDSDGAGLLCRAESLRYPLDDGIPMLLPELGQPWTPAATP